MRRFLLATVPALVSVAIVACSSDKPNNTVPSDFDTGLPIFETSPNDSGAPDTTVEPDSNMPDTTIVDTGTPVEDSMEFPDIPSTKDSAIGDVIKLMEGGPPDVPPDTNVPDSLMFVDTMVDDTGGARD